MLPKERTVKATVTFINQLTSEKTMEAALERLNTIIETQEFDLTIEENQRCLLYIMSNFPNNMVILSHVLKLIEDGLAVLIKANMQLRNEDVDNTAQPTINISSKFLEKLFYLFLVKYVIYNLI